jgi:exonuclease SbcD
MDAKTRLPGRVLDSLDILDSMIDFAAEEKIDLAIFTGDAFHTYNPSPMLLNEFYKRINNLRDICPVVMVVGNHDIVKTLDRPSSLEIVNSLGMEDVITSSTYSMYEIKTGHEIIQVATVPYPTKELLSVKKGGYDNITWAIQIAVNAKIKELVKKVNPAYPAILAGHFTVEGASYTGTDANFVGLSDAQIALHPLLDPIWDYVALGHIHGHQVLNETPPVVYSGALDRLTFSDEGMAKGFVLGTIDEKVTTWEFIETDARKYATVEVLIELDDSNPTLTVVEAIQNEDLENAVVRLIVHIPQDLQPLLDMNQVQSALDESGMYYNPARSIDAIRTKTQLRLPVKTFNPAIGARQLLKTYLTKVNGIHGEELTKLMELADEIMGEVDDEQK